VTAAGPSLASACPCPNRRVRVVPAFGSRCRNALLRVGRSFQVGPCRAPSGTVTVPTVTVAACSPARRRHPAAPPAIAGSKAQRPPSPSRSPTVNCHRDPGRRVARLGQAASDSDSEPESSLRAEQLTSRNHRVPAWSLTPSRRRRRLRKLLAGELNLTR
jgi:hypothetical protein